MPFGTPPYDPAVSDMEARPAGPVPAAWPPPRDGRARLRRTMDALRLRDCEAMSPFPLPFPLLLFVPRRSRVKADAPGEGPPAPGEGTIRCWLLLGGAPNRA